MTQYYLVNILNSISEQKKTLLDINLRSYSYARYFQSKYILISIILEEVTTLRF